MLTVDLRYKGKLVPEVGIIFNDIANRLRRPFTGLVEELSEPLKSNLDWWVEGPGSRNTLASPFFHYFCALHLVAELINKNYEISEIIVDSFSFENILKQYFRVIGKSLSIRYKGNRLMSYFKRLIKPFIVMSLELFRNTYQYWCAYKTNHLKKSVPDKSLTLIDVFVSPGFISKDRFYNGLWENLTGEHKRSTFFVPTLEVMPIMKILPAYQELRTADRNYLIKEDYLKFRDLLFAIGHYFRIIKIKTSPAIVLGVDISSLVKEELMSIRDYSSAVTALLNYRFAKRLKKEKIKLRLVIDWFENQVVDKGWNAGFKEFFPGITIIGYRGLIPSQLYLSQMSPTEIENKSNVLPTKIAVTGKGLIDSTKEFAPSINVESSPAFRFQHVWDESGAEPDPNYFTTLVALSIVYDESIYILRLVKECLKTMASTNLRFWVKPHPTMSKETLKKGLGGKWPEEFILIEGPSSDYIRKSNIVVSGMSSICLETLALGIPVILVENSAGLNYNPIPENIIQDLWRSCRTSEEISTAIILFKDRSDEQIQNHRKMGEKIKKDYFEAVTKEGVMKFLELS